MRPPLPDSSPKSRWHIAALIGCAILVLGIARFGTDAGSPWDEPSQSAYGDLIVRWFTSGFRDTSATQFENLFLYGGLFEVIAQLAAKASPLGVFETRHLLIACVGLGGIVSTGLLAGEVAGPRAGFLAGTVLTLTPAWMGHSWFNSKDIPFATAATVATWFATRIAVRGVPPSKLDTFGTGIAIGFALGVRSGGYFLLVYPLVGCLLAWLAEAPRSKASLAAVRTAGLSLLQVLAVIPVSWLLMIVAWPWAWSAPVVAPLVAMKFASSFPFSGDTLFRGQLLKATAVPSSYLPTWFAITTPELYLVAFVLGMGAFVARDRTMKRADLKGAAIVALAVVLPIGAAVITKPAIYDGLRHFLFVFPPLAALAGISAAAFIGATTIPVVARVTGVALLLITASTTVVDMTSLHPYEYVYFNRLFGGLPAARGRFDTDYWGVSYKEGFEWLVNESRISSDRPLTVSSCTESSNKRLDYYRREWPGVRDRIVIVPPEAGPDYFLESTRRYLCPQVDGQVIHTVSRQSVPMLLVRRTEREP